MSEETLQEIGAGVFGTLQEMVDAYENAEDDGAQDEAESAIQNDPLDITKQQSLEVLLSTGGPASRITVIWDDDGFHDPILEVQDWFEPWTQVPADEEVLLTYLKVLGAEYFFTDC